MATQNYEVAPYAFDKQYNNSQLADTRHVHFDLPAQKARKRGPSLHNDGNEERIYLPKPARQTRQHATPRTYDDDDDQTVYIDYVPRRRNTSSESDKTIYPHPPAHQPRRRAIIHLDSKPQTPSSHPLDRQQYTPNQPPPPPPPPPLSFPPSLPTIYILTYSTTSRTPLSSLLPSQLPTRNPPIPHLYTIDARPFTPPPPSICAQYSGIAPIVQDLVLQDPRAARALFQLTG
ncbi:hypothetical protein J1614_010542 [Plenodomus biglobosus]|nr:hypothetical protein J1614_010542 [Plenodomus biglobosus]